MGIPAPRNMQETEERSTADGMRRAIYQAQRDSALVRELMIRADAMGLSGEDRYVALAYNALVQLENVHQSLMDYIMKSPTAPLLLGERDRR
jgi:hypothetical protein